MNKCFLIGRITKDFEIRYTQSGKAVTQFILAVNTGRKDQSGKDIADFVNIVVWDKSAENCKQYVGKGSQIAVIGRITTRSYKDQQGNNRYVTEVVSEQVQFLDSKRQTNQTQSNNETPRNPFEEMHDIVEQDIPDEDLPF